MAASASPGGVEFQFETELPNSFRANCSRIFVLVDVATQIYDASTMRTCRENCCNFVKFHLEIQKSGNQI